MNSSKPDELLRPSGRSDAGSAAFSAGINELLVQISGIHDEGEALALLHEAVSRFGCTAAVFATFIRDDATMRSCRYLLAGSQQLSDLYSSTRTATDDPWLDYARKHWAPRRTRELTDLPDAQQRFIDRANEIGFRSAIIVPSHCPNGPSRVGMLCLGSDDAQYFDEPRLPWILGLAMALSLQMHLWWHDRLRRDLISRVCLTAAEIDLVRCELAGLPTKVIASRLNTPVNTIDSRFHRLCRKLEVPNRRAAAELLQALGVL